MDKQSSIKGGLPYAPDIQLLMDALPPEQMKAGSLIPHTQLLKILNMDSRNHRYDSLLNSWRGQLQKNHGVVVVWQPRLGMRVLTDYGKVGQSASYFGSGVRKIKKADKVLRAVKPSNLSEPQRDVYTHRRRVTTAVAEVLKAASKDLRVQLPKSQPLTSFAAQ